MKIAIVGSRGINTPDIERYIPDGVTEIVSGGAVGVDSSAREYAIKHGIKTVDFLPNYSKYGRRAPIVRNREITEYADCALIFWDGISRGTKNIIECFKKAGKEIILVIDDMIFEKE